MDSGLVNRALNALNISSVPWLSSPKVVLFTLSLLSVWQFGASMVLFLAAIKQVPSDLYEAARIDGAGAVRCFFKITLPLLRPTIESVLILGFIYTFKVFDLVYVMTGGGPVNSTHMLSTYSYKLSFEMFKYSKGSAVANILLVILMIVGVFYLKATKEDED